MRGSAGPGGAAGVGEGDDAVMAADERCERPAGRLVDAEALRTVEPAQEPAWPAAAGGRLYRLWAGLGENGRPFYGAAVVGYRDDEGEGPTAEDLAGKLEDAVVSAHDALTGALARIDQDRLLRPAGWSVCGED